MAKHARTDEVHDPDGPLGIVAIYPGRTNDGKHQLEQSAQAVWNATRNARDPDWENLSEDTKNSCRRDAQAVFDWLVNPLLNPHAH